MRYLLWALKLVVFVLASVFAFTFVVKNTDVIAVRYFLGYEWRAPLSIVLFVFFCAGAVIALLGGLGKVLRQQREIATLKRELDARVLPLPDPLPPDVAAL